MRAPRSLPVLLAVLVALGALVALAPALRAEDPAPPNEEARRAAVESLRKDLKRIANGPRAETSREALLAALEALGTLGGADAARAALEAVAVLDPEVRDRAFALVEREHDRSLRAPVADLLEDKRFKRDFDLHRRVAHALSVIADVEGMTALTDLIASEDAQVVAAAADALGTFGSAPHRHRLEPVKRLIDLYESTWNLMNSVRREDAVISKVMRERWDVYGKSVRAALQALARQPDLLRPQDWRRWWNDNKKRTDW